MPSVTYDEDGKVISTEEPTAAAQVGIAPRTDEGDVIGTDGLPMPPQRDGAGAGDEPAAKEG